MVRVEAAVVVVEGSEVEKERFESKAAVVVGEEVAVEGEGEGYLESAATAAEGEVVVVVVEPKAVKVRLHSKKES